MTRPESHLFATVSQLPAAHEESASGNGAVTSVELPGPSSDAVGGPSQTRMPTGAAGSPPAAPPQLVDPSVSLAKFEREIRNYRAMETEYLRRGWLLIRAEYPDVVVLFAAPHIIPSPVVLGAVINFRNYDFWAPSVRFVHPFTLAPLLIRDMPTRLWRRVPATSGAGDIQALLQHQADQVPFLCIKGVREYHDHPVHSNDPWLAHRGTGVGTLYYILNVIHRYGVAPFTQLGIHVRSMEFVVGLRPPDQSNIPE